MFYGRVFGARGAVTERQSAELARVMVENKDFRIHLQMLGAPTKARIVVFYLGPVAGRIVEWAGSIDDLVALLRQGKEVSDAEETG